MATQYKYEPKIISIKDFIALRGKPINPINNLAIPNINMPEPLRAKTKHGEDVNGIKMAIRVLLNRVSENNIENIKNELKSEFMDKVKTAEHLQMAAEEFLSSFTKNGLQIPYYIELFNTVSMSCIKIKDNGKESFSKTLGNYFLGYCHIEFKKKTSCENIKKIAEYYNPDDDDDMDLYFRYIEEINNLVVTICHLYSQRNEKKICLSAVQLIPLISSFINNVKLLIKNKTEVDDDYELDILDNSIDTYSKIIYFFLKNKLSEFVNDKTVVDGKTFNDHISDFKTEIIPNLTSGSLRELCGNLTI